MQLDADNVVVSETPETEDTALLAEYPHLQDMMAHGAKFEKRGNTIMVQELPALEQEVFRFFSLSQPCWFGGCEKLREEYAEAKAAADCPKCEGTLIRKFTPRVRQALQQHHEKEAIHTGT